MVSTRGVVVGTLSAVLVAVSAAVISNAGPAPAVGVVVKIPSTTINKLEGNAGSAVVTINATLNQVATSTVTVAYSTIDGTAKVSDADYVATSGTLTFVPGDVSEPIVVTVNGDLTLEDYQSFSVKLTTPVNATLGNASEVVQIQNDETPSLSMASLTVVEGAPANFAPTLLQRYYLPITLNTQTTNGTASSVTDYTPVNAGSVTFAAGTKTPQIVAVATTVDTTTEPNETFTFKVSGTGIAAAVTKTATIASQLCVAQAQPTTYAHVVVVVMENHTYNSVIGSAAAPWLTGVARACGTATAYAQAGSPSRPNYIAMAAGDTFDCAGNNSDPVANNCHPTSQTVFKQVIDAGGTATVYGESMNSNCDATSHGLYAVKHNAWPYFPAEAALCQQFNQVMPASIDVNNLPTLLEVMPNLCHDSHDCSVAVGDAWLAQYIQPIFDSPAYLSGDTAVIVTYDEYTNLPNAFASRSATKGTVIATPTTHYTLLRTVEDLLGLAPLGQAATATGLRTVMHL